MGKRKKKPTAGGVELKEFECLVHGSTNGWLKVTNNLGEVVMFQPEFHQLADKPVSFFLLGKYSTFDEQEVEDGTKKD